MRRLGPLEADQVGAEHAEQQFGPAGQLHEQLGRRERHVQEEADPQVRAERPEQARYELQVVVLHPDHGARFGGFRGGFGEPLVDPLVGLPPAAVVDGLLDRVVVERPQGGVGETLVVVPHVLVTEWYRVHPYAVDVGYGGSGATATGPADPDRRGLLQDGM